MFHHDWMVGGFGTGFMLLGWITSLLFLVLLVLTIIALWKYINRK